MCIYVYTSRVTPLYSTRSSGTEKDVMFPGFHSPWPLAQVEWKRDVVKIYGFSVPIYIGWGYIVISRATAMGTIIMF